jgi:DNA-binding NtrC family response regulator
LFDERESEPRARGETILVVEDDPDVRSLAVALLSDLGYEILEAEDAQSALAVLDNNPWIAMLFTDVILPGGMNGPTLAEEVKRRYPEMFVLFTSGYTDDVTIPLGEVDAGVELLNKPFGKSDLALKVRSVLDRAVS